MLDSLSVKGKDLKVKLLSPGEGWKKKKLDEKENSGKPGQLWKIINSMMEKDSEYRRPGLLQNQNCWPLVEASKKI